MGTRIMSFIVLAIAASFVVLDTTAAETIHLVGDTLGWLVPPGGSMAYATWAQAQTFTLGDILVFNFTTGDQDVARVTKEAFDSCNSTNTISLKTDGPANFTLDTIGEYYFIGTMNRRCSLGQKLAINVSAPGPAPSPSPPRGPIAYTVGDGLGWLVPPGGSLAYATWALNKTFIVGDTLEFGFDNKTQDVAVVTKEVYESCNTNNTISVYTTSPAKIELDRTGEYFFTSTFDRHCVLGQKLSINVTASSPSPSPSSPADGPSAQSAPAPFSSAPTTTRVAGAFFVTLLAIVVVALF